MEVERGSGREYEAPGTEIEKQLVGIWAEVLKLAPEKIGIKDNFFELGGHSLSAVRLMAKMNERFKQSLPLAVMFTAPNIAALAKLISSKQVTPVDILVPIQTNGDAPLIFGVVAYEMARMLLEQGEKISSLVLLDSIAPAVKQEEPALDDARELFDACMTVAELSGAQVEIDIEWLRKSSDEENIRYIVELLNGRGQEITTAQFAAFYNIYRANLRCYRTYKPSLLPCQIDVSLYRASQEHQNRTTLLPDYGWNQLLYDPIRIYDVEADHFSILEKVNIQRPDETGRAYKSLAATHSD
jgi:acyl carrier protein/surfactin synthase thioesterase subunit